VLDLGCGVGDLTARLADEVGAGASGGGQVLGLDASASCVRLAAQRSRPGLAFVVGLAQDVGRLLRPASLDAVVTVATLHWVPEADQPGVLRDLARVLRPGGVLRVDMGGHGQLLELREDLADLLDAFGAPHCPWFFPTAERFAELLTQAGFAVARCELVTQHRRLPDAAAVQDWLVSQVLPAWTAHVPQPNREAFTTAAVGRVLARPRRADGGLHLDYVRVLATGFSSVSAAPHGFPGAAGEAADALAEAARKLAEARSRGDLPEERLSLWHKRFEIAAAVARRDPAAAGALLEALGEEVAGSRPDPS
jgi:trans-aconitate methyltransferase